MAATARMRQTFAGLGLLMLPACLSSRHVAAPSTPPAPPPTYQANAIRQAEPPRPVITFQPAPLAPQPAPPAAPRPERTEEPASAVGPEVAAPPKAHPVEPPLLSSLRLYLDRRPDEAVERLKAYGPVNQEFLLALIPALARAAEGDLGRADPAEVAALVESLHAAASVLKSRAELRAERVCFCKRAVKFGIFDPVGDNHSFRPGEMAELYVELRNVVGESQAAPARGVVTRLATEMTLRDGANRLVWREDCDRSELSQSPRQDLDVHYRFGVPNLPAGGYTLWVKIVDKSTNRSVTRAVDFRVTTMPAPGT